MHFMTPAPTPSAQMASGKQPSLRRASSPNAGSGQALLDLPARPAQAGWAVGWVGGEPGFQFQDGQDWVKRWKDPLLKPGHSAPARLVMGYFYFLHLTVQAQGPQTVAAACGNWLMSHLATALIPSDCPCSMAVAGGLLVPTGGRLA